MSLIIYRKYVQKILLTIKEREREREREREDGEGALVELVERSMISNATKALICLRNHFACQISRSIIARVSLDS